MYESHKLLRTFISASTALSVALAASSGTTAAADTDSDRAAPDYWCPPKGPTLEGLLRPDNELMLRKGWVKFRMRVRPGAVPVTDVRVVSEARGPSHARVMLPLVRQWIGCADNKRDVQLEFTFGLEQEDVSQALAPEGFGLYAFQAPHGAPVLPTGSYGVGVCPVKATLKLTQPVTLNEVVNLESAGGSAVTEWLRRLIPDRDYMEPNPAGNRVEFECRVDAGEVKFNVR